MPALGYNRREGAEKPKPIISRPPPAQRGQNIGPLKGGIGPLPRPQAQPKAPAFSPHLQETFGPLGHGVGAPSKVGNQAAQQRGFHTYQEAQREAQARGGVGQGVVPVKQGAGYQAEHTGLKVGIATPSVATFLGSHVLAERPNLGKTATNIVPSITRLVTGIPGALYQGGKATEELVRGKPTSALHIAEGLKEVANHPGKFLEKEPASFATLFMGGESAVSRLAGATKETRPLNLYEGVGGPVQQVRTSPPSVIRKGIERVSDKVRERAWHEAPDQAGSRRLERTLARGKMGGGLVKPGQVDVMHGMGETFTRLVNGVSQNFLRNTKLKGKQVDNPSLYYEGYVRRPETAVEDANRRLSQLQREHDALPRGQQRLNEVQQRGVERFLASSPEQHVAAEKVARTVAGEYEPKVNEMVNIGHLEPNQPNAALMGFGLTHGEGLGRGPLHRYEGGDLHPKAVELKAADKELQTAEKSLLATRVKVGGSRPLAENKDQALKLDREARDAVRAKRNILRNEISHMKAARTIRQDGTMWPHLRDMAENPVHPTDLRALWDRETNGRKPGFITHREAPVTVISGRGASQRAGVVNQPRTGTHAMSGAYDNSWNAITRQFKMADRAITGHLNENQMAMRFAAHLSNDKQDAEAIARHLSETKDGHGIEWKVRSVAPDKILGHANMQEMPGLRGIHELSEPDVNHLAESSKFGKWAVIPKVVHQGMEDHYALKTPGSLAKMAQKVTGYFRHSALFTSVRWPIGVNQEQWIRSVANGINPLALYKWTRNKSYLAGFSPKAGKTISDELANIIADPNTSTAEKLYAQQIHGAVGLGSQYGQDVSAHLSETVGDLTPHERTMFQAFQAHAGPRQVLSGWEHQKDYMGHLLQGMESNAKEAGLGKIALKEIGGFKTKWAATIGKQDQLVRDWTKGKVDPNQAVHLTEQLFDMYGNWNNLAPLAKSAQKTWSPFGLWWLNSMKFVLKTLPKDHPLGTAAMTALVQGTGANKAGAGLPEYLQGDLPIHLPLVGSIDLNPLHYSPFDTWREPNKRAVEMIAPLAQSTMKELEGGKTKAEPQEAALKAFEQGVLGMVPYGRLGVEAAAKGPEAALIKRLFPIPYSVQKAEPKGIAPPPEGRARTSRGPREPRVREAREPVGR